MLQASLSEVLVYMGLWVPWPLTQPAILIRALGMDLLQSEGAMIVSMQDLGDVLPPDLDLVPGHEARKRYSLHPSCFRFEPLPPEYPGGPPRVDTTVIATLDSKKVPVNDTVISFLLKGLSRGVLHASDARRRGATALAVFAPVVYRTVIVTCNRLFHRTAPEDSPLMRRMRERAELYLPQALSIDRHLRAHGWDEQLPQIRGLHGRA
ncbi:hypothetical protein MNEG_14273 [Monoraphidium neglectum]|uniref:Uncharacterized protein n=1 Tax=Monoraphidium neglectum TaxID=145388 RepID=A0A0D2KD43_9CHLO|nr:hypothetical protein MNEG_14273 [Monoraphidium neglectum]KIY93688.1 hypothetical protein MNEG_14273 [Monoraphidium neglectum]|eukprot:XP_013892708.1 hypothetical protein MNEG_14273 [Monoraphidium neglectum]